MSSYRSGHKLDTTASSKASLPCTRHPHVLIRTRLESRSYFNSKRGSIWGSHPATPCAQSQYLVNQGNLSFDLPFNIGRMTVKVLAPRDVHTTLNYYQPRDQLPYYYIGVLPPEGMPVHNVSNEPHSTIIHDARGKQDAFGLDTSGFQWVRYPSAEKEFRDRERIKTVYYPEVEKMLRKHVRGARKVVIFNHTLRRSSEPETEPARCTDRGPAHIVHADQSFTGAELKVREVLPDDAERLMKGRFQIINVWRPIANNVAHNPLGVVDFRTINVVADLVPVRVIYPNRESGSYNVKYNPSHKWYYLSDQTPDEVLLLKCFDSDTDKARLAPHSAFPDMTSPVDAPQRQSIEVRALVFDSE